MTEPATTQEIRAEMAGVVKDVLVAPGDAVRQGQEIVLIESMKMDIPLAAPRDGIIGSVHVDAGARVDRGDLLLTLA